MDEEEKHLLDIRLQNRRLEANKLYVLGLRLFLDTKQRKRPMKKEEKELLEHLLMDHHTNRLLNILKIKKSA